jgi:bifunctional DNase/RNase
MELHKIIIIDSDIDDPQKQQIIVLQEVNGSREFPIVIGKTEAKAIKQRLEGVPPIRPMTHDLLANVIEELGGSLDHIEITNLQEHTFYAQLHIRQNGRIVQVDSRPSDAIALGIASSVPIYVAQSVLDEVC